MFHLHYATDICGRNYATDTTKSSMMKCYSGLPSSLVDLSLLWNDLDNIS